MTAPLVAQNFDERKVLQEMQARNDQTVAAYRAQVQRAEDDKVAAVAAKLDAQRAELIRETAGKSVSGRVGIGPVAKAMQDNLRALEGDLAEAKAAAVRHVDAVTRMPPEHLARTAGVRLLDDNADTRAVLRRQLNSGDGEKLYGLPASQVVASALLALLFVMMVLLKTYQPWSVAIYFNDYLQEQYEKYVAGGFSDLPLTVLPANDRHDGPSPMGALRFDNWFHGAFLGAKATIERERERESRLAAHKAHLGHISDRKAVALERKVQAEEGLDAALTDKWTLETERNRNLNDIAELEQRMSETNANLNRRRRAILNAERAQKQLDVRALEDRKAEIMEDLCTRIPDALEAAMTGLDRVMKRHGKAPDELPTDEVRANPIYRKHLEERVDLMAERHASQQEKLKIEKQLERLGERLRQIEVAFVTGEMEEVDLDDTDTTLQQHRAEAQSQRREHDERAVRERVLNEKLRRQGQTVADRQSEFDRCREEVATFQDDEREAEARVAHPGPNLSV